MGYALFGNQKIDISFHSNYKKALFGVFHVGFIDNNNWLVLPVDDKESLISAYWFYKNRILKEKSYPVYDGSSFALKPANSLDVFKQVFGLPEDFYKRVDYQKDLLPQLRFASNTTTLKKECYLAIYQPLNRKWFTDDFKLFCLVQGFYFPFDETKPFVEGITNGLPVYINEKGIKEEDIRSLYSDATSSRFSIDFLGKSTSKQFIDWMKKLDIYSFDRRLAYFVNATYDEDLANLSQNEEFRLKYSLLCRQYLASLINVLYDHYSFEVLNKVTAKLSFMYVSLLHDQRDIYVLSSYNGDMYSYDKKNWFFNILDKSRIKTIIQNELEDDDTPLSFYSKLGLPFPGFKYVSSLDNLTVNGILKSLPFEEGITDTISYLSAKRFDMFYSYLEKEKEHRFVFFDRKLKEEGIEINSSIPLLSKDPQSLIKVNIRKARRDPLLVKMFDIQDLSLFNDILPSYSLADNPQEKEIREALKSLDEKSNNSAITLFFDSFKEEKNIVEAIDGLCKQLDLQSLSKPYLIDFFFYLLSYPFLIVEREYRLKAINSSDTRSLVALDGLPKMNETYEPNLPYPYVTFGLLCYSFRESYFSTPFICSSESEAIVSRIEYYGSLFDYESERKHKNRTSIYERNVYILTNLGLPDNINSLINPDKSILPQIPFKDDICHLCRHSSPSYYESLDEDKFESYNMFSTYIRAISSKKGVYFNKLDMENFFSVDSLVDSLKDSTYKAVLFFDRKRVDPILLPYIDVTKGTIVAMLSCFFPSDVSYIDFAAKITSFLNLGIDTIKKLLFDCTPDLYPLIYKNQGVFIRLYDIYKMIEIGYALYVSRDEIPSLNQMISLNLDYNPRLPYPYIHLGRVFNAYANDSISDKFYFCECDHKPMVDLLKKIFDNSEAHQIDKQIETPIILGVAGLPFRVVAKFADYDLSLGSIDDLVSRFEFREAICRRCTNINHSAYAFPFGKAYPFKDDKEADYSFANNSLAHQGILVMYYEELSDVSFDPNYSYNLAGNDDFKLPSILFASKVPADCFYSFLTMDKDKLKEDLFDFGKLLPDKQEALAYATGVILDTYSTNKEVFFGFLTNLGQDSTIKEMVLTYFPQINRVRKEFLSVTAQTILGFLTYLLEKFIEQFVLEEARVGR